MSRGLDKLIGGIATSRQFQVDHTCTVYLVYRIHFEIHFIFQFSDTVELFRRGTKDRTV